MARSITDSQLILLCLDHLRDLRRNYSMNIEEMKEETGLDGDYITIAIWALSRCFAKPKELKFGLHRQLEQPPKHDDYNNNDGTLSVSSNMSSKNNFDSPARTPSRRGINSPYSLGIGSPSHYVRSNLTVDIKDHENLNADKNAIYNYLDRPLEFGNDPKFQHEAAHLAFIARKKEQAAVAAEAIKASGATSRSQAVKAAAAATAKFKEHPLSDKIFIPPLHDMEMEFLYKVKPTHSLEDIVTHAPSPTPHSRKTPNSIQRKIKYDNDTSIGTDRNNSLEESALAEQKCNEDNLNPRLWYEYEDAHYSNAQRFYPLNGLGCTPLTLMEVASSGISTLEVCSRAEAEDIIVKDEMFQQFLNAVTEKGFFDISELDITNAPVPIQTEEDADDFIEGETTYHEDKKVSHDGNAEADVGGGHLRKRPTLLALERFHAGVTTKRTFDMTNKEDKEEKERKLKEQEILDQRYRKVVMKFRTKLAQQAQDYIQEEHTEEEAHLDAVNHENKRDNDEAASNNNSDVEEQKEVMLIEVGEENVEIHHNQSRPERKRLHKVKKNLNFYSSSDSHDISKETSENEGVMSALSMKEQKGSTKSHHHPAIPRSSYDKSPGKSADRKHHSRNISASSTGSSIAKNDNNNISINSQNEMDDENSNHYPQEEINEAERLKARGNAEMQAKNYVRATEEYTMALNLVPNGPTSHVYYSNRAAALISMKDYNKAIRDSEKSLSLKPEYGKAHARMGLAYFLLGEFKLAMNAYELAVKYEPDNGTNRGYLEKSRKKYLAMKARKYKKEESKNDSDENNLSHNDSKEQEDLAGKPSRESRHSKNRSSRELDVQNKSRDHDSVRAALSDGNENTVVKANKKRDKRDEAQKQADRLKTEGNDYMTAKQYEKAINSYSAALRICPDGPTSHVYLSNRAAALCYLERYDEAELDAENSLTLQPDYGKAYARLGLSRYYLGDYKGSAEAYEVSLQYEPDNASSKSYFAKAKSKLSKSRQKRQQNKELKKASSFQLSRTKSYETTKSSTFDMRRTNSFQLPRY
eukprot:CAMPEP_0184861760 /NCGR_PEP_ID=MMETSP0580-20130426/6364_1 /TAXON_ID=1118495 /ORGANISM="Dactyliosolen fragilissimus" /LENGTH=1036 /DNA_ID=CAMNT_0027359359 /DNA_START=55 /DNA_END=3165 /DNA_ORIENTATION=-